MMSEKIYKRADEDSYEDDDSFDISDFLDDTSEDKENIATDDEDVVEYLREHYKLSS